MSLVAEKENLQKLRYLFEEHSNDGNSLTKKELLRFFTELGLNSDLFLSDLYFYFPEIQHDSGSCNILNFEQILQFLDYLLLNKKHDANKVEAFKTFDRSGTGQISTAELLAVLKKKLSQKQYEMYQKLISNSYGPLINYMEIFKKAKTK